MTAPQWEDVKRLFHAALEHPADRRAAWLAQQCSQNPDVCAEVDRLLAAHLAAGSFIETPAADLHSVAGRQPGARVGTWMGQYRLDAHLGSGGMGDVYQALDSELGRVVAIKVVGRDVSGAHERLRREARHASRLNHPNICTIHHVGDSDGHPYIVMELVDGRPLSELISAGGLPAGTVVSYAGQVLDALEHAHEKRVVHRDLKSANVMIRSDGQLKLLDFGLARRLDAIAAGPQAVSAQAADRMTSAGGTLPYMAPEILRGGVADARTDLWGFGVLLYEMLTGRLPFGGTTALDVGSAILNDTPSPMPATVPRALASCIMRCLEKDPERRPQHASEVKAQLDRVARRGSGAAVAPRRIVAAIALSAVLLTTIAVASRQWRASGGGAPPAIRSIAVLPLENLSGDAAQDYFAEGLTESLIAELRKTSSLQVTSPTTSMRYRGSPRPLADLARDLKVDAIVQGSVVREGGGIRIATALLRVADGRVWTDRFERPAREIHALERDFVESAANHVSLALTPSGTSRLARVRAVAPDVYESYLKGRFYWNKRTTASLAAAVEHFRAAIALDPTYAPAHVGLADCYNQLGTVLVASGSPAAMRPQAAAAAIAALQIDPALAEAHAALGYVRHYDWQWAEAERSLRHALDLDPNNALVHLWYANYLGSLRRMDEAVAHAEKAKALDPLSPTVLTNVGWTLSYAGRYHDAVAAYREALALDADYIQANQRLAAAQAELAQFDDALATNEKVGRLTNRGGPYLTAMANILAMAGRREEAEQALTRLLAVASTGYVSPFSVSQPHFRLGHIDRGFEWLERAYEERSNGMVYLAAEPAFARVRTDARYRDLLKRVGLPLDR